MRDLIAKLVQKQILAARCLILPPRMRGILSRFPAHLHASTSFSKAPDLDSW
jgi:hypothetical protein